LRLTPAPPKTPQRECGFLTSYFVCIHADVILSEHAATLNAFTLSPNLVPGKVPGRWYARNSRFKKQDGGVGPFFVFRGGALALDSCTIEASEVAGTEEACSKKPVPRFCRYSDGSPFGKGSFLLV
jgi:hypothetical protein